MTLDGESEIARHALPHGRTLIWRDDGSPYDNSMHINVLAADATPTDAVEAGVAFTANILARGNVRVCSISPFSQTTELIV